MKTEIESISTQRLKLENALLWKFVYNISCADDTHDGKVANALIKRFKKEKNKLGRSRLRLPSIHP